MKITVEDSWKSGKASIRESFKNLTAGNEAKPNEQTKTAGETGCDQALTRAL